MPYLGDLSHDHQHYHNLATVPTLVVPLQRTLTDDVESRYKAITETKVGHVLCGPTALILIL
jgi:hypothetical protein